MGPEEDFEIPIHNITREKEWYSDVKMSIPKTETIDPFENKKDIEYGVPNQNFFTNASHKDIYSSGMINVAHWDAAKWKGVMYLGDLENYSVIKIGFLFNNEEGARRVFQDLIDCVGKYDEEERIVLSFIKGINKERIYDYRVMITGKVKVPKNTEKNILIQMMTRFHEMNCEDDKNIGILETVIKNEPNPKIVILPMINNDKEQTIKPLWDYEISLKHVNIKNAYEISKEDYEAMVIKKEDKPIIPEDVKNTPINELLEIKNKIE